MAKMLEGIITFLLMKVIHIQLSDEGGQAVVLKVGPQNLFTELSSVHYN